MKGLVHLKVRSQYNYDSTVAIPNLLRKVKEEGMDAVAVVDRHSMHGAVEFMEAAKKEGITPIIGVELTVKGKEREHPLTLLAMNEEGYAHLCALSSYAYYDREKKKEKHRPFVTTEDVKERAAGILALIPVTPFIKETLEHLTFWEGLFGKENVYAEITPSSLTSDFTQHMLPVLRERGVKIVASTEIRAIQQGDNRVAHVLKAISEEKKELAFSKEDCSFRSAEELTTLFGPIPEALHATKEVARRCRVDIPFKGEKGFARKVPVYPVPAHVTIPPYVEKRYPGESKEHQRSISYLYELTMKRFCELYPKGEIEPSYYEKARNRVIHELSVVVREGFTDYLLIIYDLVRYADKVGIPISPGRGSSASSIVVRCLDIVKGICPIQHQLLFERFLNVERGDDPDVDLDFSAERRHEIIQYAQKKYGFDHVAILMTFDSFGLKSGFGSVAKLWEIPKRDVYEKQIEDASSLEELLKKNPKLQQAAKKDKRIQFALECAFLLKGYPKNESTHAAGLVLSKEALTTQMPVKLTAEKGSNTPILKTQIADEDGRIERIGYSKIDVLGVAAVDVWWKTKQLIQKRHGVSLDTIPRDDPNTMNMFQKGELLGVFQMDSKGMRGASREIVPSTFQDIVALLALYRPGPMQYIPVYANNKKEGRVALVDEHNRELVGVDDIVPIVSDTFGIIVYQEQIMQIAHVWAGYSYGQGDDLRRSISKKKIDIMEKERQVFLNRSFKRGRDPKLSERLFNVIVKFANYGFNRSHSTIYGLFAYEMAYLKQHYPVEFMTSRLAVLAEGKKTQTEDAALYYQEAKRLGIMMMPPDVNHSGVTFSLDEKGAVSFGLPVIKHVGKGAARDLVRVRESGGHFTSFTDFIQRTKETEIKKKAKEVLIKVGALDAFGSRKEMLQRLENGDVEKRDVYTFSAILGVRDIPAEEFPASEKWKMERTYLSMIVSDPIEEMKAPIQRLWEENKERPEKGKWIAGLVERVYVKKYPNGREMAFLTVQGSKASYTLLLFDNVWRKEKEKIQLFGVYLFKGEETDEPDKLITSLVLPVSS